MQKIEPLSPTEIQVKWTKVFEPLVIEAVNNLLIKKYSPNKKDFVIKQHEITTEIKCLLGDQTMEQKDIKIKELYANNQLDIEEFYRKAGWEVLYDKPGYNEMHDAFFEFSIPKK